MPVSVSKVCILNNSLEELHKLAYIDCPEYIDCPAYRDRPAQMRLALKRLALHTLACIRTQFHAPQQKQQNHYK